MNTRKWMLVAATMASLGVLACDDDDGNDNTNTNEPAVPADSGVGNRDAGPGGPLDGALGRDAGRDGGDEDASTTELTDGQIASVTTAANAGEVAQANAARPKLQNERAQDYAQRMIDDHEAAQVRQQDLLNDKNISPQPAPQATELTQQSTAIVADITAASEADVDRLYMQAQVEVHQQVLDLLDDVLIPSADDEDLKEELEKTRDAVKSHLDEAKDILSELD